MTPKKRGPKTGKGRPGVRSPMGRLMADIKEFAEAERYLDERACQLKLKAFHSRIRRMVLNAEQAGIRKGRQFESGRLTKVAAVVQRHSCGDTRCIECRDEPGYMHPAGSI